MKPYRPKLVSILIQTFWCN